MKKTWPAALRNAEPIVTELKRILPASATVLEIASGTGQHAAHFSCAMPSIQWQPSEYDESALSSIEDWRLESETDNFREPMLLDVCVSPWPIQSVDFVFCANMIHIAPWKCCLGLLNGAGQVISESGALLLYGPFIAADVVTADSNEAFDASLRGRNPGWGIRQLEEVESAAREQHLVLAERVAMPANNLLLVFRRG
jgi:hypothetical protein